MAKTSIIQLSGVDGDHLALYVFDPDETDEKTVITFIESAIEAAFQRDEKGEIEDGDILTEADATLENLGIDRVFAGKASTVRL